MPDHCNIFLQNFSILDSFFSLLTKLDVDITIYTYNAKKLSQNILLSKTFSLGKACLLEDRTSSPYMHIGVLYIYPILDPKLKSILSPLYLQIKALNLSQFHIVLRSEQNSEIGFQKFLWWNSPCHGIQFLGFKTSISV